MAYTINLTTGDRSRAARMLLARLTQDELQLRAVLAEARAKPERLSRLLFALTDQAALLAQAAAPDAEQQVRLMVQQLATKMDEDGDEPA